ncbi:MAG: PAS domain-containing protein [Porphyromonas sp.]|nr:PAS domain-containing protein [Porphyromonas sp.]
MDYFDKADLAITICDKEGKIIEMNEQSRQVNLKPGQDLIGSNVLDCHPEPARSMLKKMMEEGRKNVYTIEKGEIKKMIYQIPWYDADGQYAGFAELSMIIPFDMPHKIRKPRNPSAQDTAN